MRSFDTAYEGSQCNTCLQNVMKSDSHIIHCTHTLNSTTYYYYYWVVPPLSVGYLITTTRMGGCAATVSRLLNNYY